MFFSLFISMHSKFQQQSAIDLATCEIIRNGKLLVGNVGYPIIGIDVVDTEKVETVHPQPYIPERTLLVGTLFIVIGTETHTYVGTLVGGSTEVKTFNATVGSREGKAVSIRQFEGHLPSFRIWEVVGEKQIEGKALVGGHGDVFAM